MKTHLVLSLSLPFLLFSLFPIQVGAYPLDPVKTIKLPMYCSNLKITNNNDTVLLVNVASGLVKKIDPVTDAFKDSLQLSVSHFQAISFFNNQFLVMASDTLFLLDSNGAVLETYPLGIMGDFFDNYGSCVSLCRYNNELFSIWAFCWCGRYALIKTDIAAKKSVKIKEIPLYHNLLSLNDTLWMGNTGLKAFYSGSDTIVSNGILEVGENTWMTNNSTSVWTLNFNDCTITRYAVKRETPVLRTSMSEKHPVGRFSYPYDLLGRAIGSNRNTSPAIVKVSDKKPQAEVGFGSRVLRSGR